MRFPFNIGLKLHTINTELISEAIRLWQDGIYQYIELYVVPGSYNKTREEWKSCKIPYILHAAHSYDGINFASRALKDQNHINFSEVQQFADILDSNTIIIHAGMNGSIEETLYQVKILNDSRLVLENKPKVAIRGEPCVGWSPIEFKKIATSGLFKGFVLDFGHAECAARSIGIDSLEYAQKFIDLKPEIYHISDGESESEKDTHRNFGKGDRNLSKFIKLIPPGVCLTIETPRDEKTGLNDFIDDLYYLKDIMDTI